MTDSIASTPGVRQRRASQKRDRLIDAARQTLHKQGVAQTTLADVATAADVPLGNVYYYFKTKDDLVAAVLDAYYDQHAAIEERLAAQATPQERLKTLVRIFAGNPDRLTRYGCPIGSLCSELDKRDDDALTRRGADVLSRLVDLAAREFAALGRADARQLAIALVAAYEGAALLANTLRDPHLVVDEAARLEAWIDAIVSS